MNNSLLFECQICNLSKLIIDNYKSDDLSNIMSKYESDKGFGLCDAYINNTRLRPKNQVCHNYTFYYNNLFCNYRLEKLQIFEMGVGVPACMGLGSWAGSLKGWAEYFPNSEIFSADFDKEYLYCSDRIKSFYVDQENQESIKKLWQNDELNRTFDLIIDDGPHTFSSNYLFFVNSFNKLKIGGIYIIEDINLDFIDNLYNDIKKFCNNSLIKIDIEKILIPWPLNFTHACKKILNMNNLIIIKKLN
jgi:hypothetical protein